MTNIIVAFPNQDNATNIKNLLTRSGYSVAAVCTTGAAALNATERFEDGILVCGYKFHDMIYSQIRDFLPKNVDMLLVASQDKWEDCSNNDVVCIAMPLKINDFLNTVEMMTQAIYRRRKKLKAQPKVRSEEEVKLIDEAKKVLIEKNNMTEPEAHRYIQKTSMDSGNTLLETARMVLDIMLR